MTTMNKLALAAMATAALAAAPAAYAGSNLQGPRLTGIALESLEAGQPAITAVTLPSGEAVDLQHRATAPGVAAGPGPRAAD